MHSQTSKSQTGLGSARCASLCAEIPAEIIWTHWTHLWHLWQAPPILSPQSRVMFSPKSALWIAPTFLAAPLGNWTSAPARSFMVKSTVILTLVKQEGYNSKTNSCEMKTNAPPRPEGKSTAQREWNREVATQFGLRFPFHKPPNHPDKVSLDNSVHMTHLGKPLLSDIQTLFSKNARQK